MRAPRPAGRGDRRRSPTPAALAVAAAVALAVVGGVAHAAFTATAGSAGNVVAAASDFRPPAVTAAAVAKASGGTAGYVRPGGAYFVYANVAADTGAPPSGLASVTADATALAGGAAVPLAAGSYSAGGVAYGYRSAELTAGAGVPAGERSVAVTATDVAGNADTLAAQVSVDATAPTAVDLQGVEGGGTEGLLQAGDSLVLTFSEPIEPQSVLSGWTGAPTAVTVRAIDNGLLGLPLGNDELRVYDAADAAALPLGAFDLGRGDYVAGLLGGSFRLGTAVSPSSMELSANTITITFGAYFPTLLNAVRTTAGGAGTIAWTPTATPYDRAANPLSTAVATESGPADRDF